MEKSYEYGKNVHMCFIDFIGRRTTAYFEIHCEFVKVVKEFGIPNILIQLIKKCNTHNLCHVILGDCTSQSFEI